MSDLGSGGAQRVVTTVVNTWAVRGRRICVMTLGSQSGDFFSLHPSVRRVVVGGGTPSATPWHGLVANLRRIVRLRYELRRSGAPVVAGFVGSTNVLLILASFGLKLTVVISERSDPSRQSLGRVWEPLRRVFYRYADVVTANSRGVIESLSAFVPRHKLAYLPNPLGLCLSDYDGGDRTSTILCVGRLTREKGSDVLLDAFAAVASRCPVWRLSMVGDGPLKAELRTRAERLRLSERIDWHGEVDAPARHYRRSSAFVLASRREGMPNALLEAMSCGLPVIVTNASPGPLELVENEVSGLVVPAEDSPALARALMRLLLDDALRRRLGHAARNRVSQFALSEVLPVWEQVLGLDGLPVA